MGRQNLLSCTVLATLAILVLVVAVMSESDADISGISIEEAAYDTNEGKIFLSGCSSYPFVSLKVVGDGYQSPIDSTAVNHGWFEERFYIGQLKNGTYTVEAWCDDCRVSKTFTVDDGIVVTSIDYNPNNGKISFEGTTKYPFVNAMVMKGQNKISPITSCNVTNGHFNETFSIGSLSPGTYRLNLSYVDIGVDTLFEVTDRSLVINNMLFDKDQAKITVIGKTYLDSNPGFKVRTPQDAEYDFAYWQNTDGTFVAYAFVGMLQDNETYTLIIPSEYNLNNYEFLYSDYSDENEIDYNGNILKDKGHTLVKFSGNADAYIFPDSVTSVMDGAFADCKIKKIVIDRDLDWRIEKKDGMSFMFQNCGIETILIKEGVTSIPDYLFAKTDISTINIPSSVELIGVKAFYDCNELISVRFEDNSQITLIGDYSFSHNEVLESVSFGSSKDGFHCEIGTAAFLFCYNLTRVDLNNDFNLRTIGQYAFTKQYDKHSYANPASIAFNSIDGILIPKETVEVGKLAFSNCAPNNVILDIMDVTYEPLIGCVQERNISSTTYVMEGICSIVAEEGSQLTLIDKGAFAVNSVQTIDLSECTLLKTIQKGAFSKCLNGGVLELPPNIEELYESFVNKSANVEFNEDLILPNSLRVIDKAFDGLDFNIRAQEGSLLEYYSESASSTYERDFSKCNRLTYVSSINENIRIIPGVYDGMLSSSSITGIIPPVKNGNSIEITKQTSYLNWELASLDIISCDEENPYFKIENGGLYYLYGGDNILLRVLTPNEFHVKAGSNIRDGLLGTTITDLVIHSDNVLAEGSLSDCDSLMALSIDGTIDVTMLQSALEGLKSCPTIYIDQTYSDQDLMSLSALGNLVYVLNIDENVFYVPVVLNNDVIHYQIDSSNMSLETDRDLENNVFLITSGLSATVEGSTIRVFDIYGANGLSIWFMPLMSSEQTINLSFDLGGGTYGSLDQYNVEVESGTTLSECQLPVPVKNLHRFDGWSLEEGGAVLSGMYRFDSDQSLYAIWSPRNPLICVDTEVSDFYCNQFIFDTKEVAMHSNVELTAQPKLGFELQKWVVNGVEVSDASQSLSLEDICDDLYISLTYRYYSSSSGLIPITDRGLPTIQESGDLVKVTELGGILDMSKTIWDGHASVPLIVDDRIYFRAGNYLYVAESDTGYILNSVPSAEARDYYHQLGYGDGVIIDYKTSKAYDLDLNELYTLECPITGVQLHNGVFYTSGNSIYSFTPGVDSSVVNGIKHMDFVAYVPNVYSTYGFTTSVYVDNYNYRIVVDGFLRGISAIDLETHEVNTVYLDSIRSMYLDDGWISYYNGYLYLPGYTMGLFGEIATDSDDVLAYISVNGLQFGEEQFHVFEGNRGWPSQLIVYENNAFITVGSTLYKFSINDGVIDFDSQQTTTLAAGHGSMIMDISHVDDESVLYFYAIPYYTKIMGLSIVEYKGGELISHDVRGLPVNYNSQAVRADIDGRMIWYNDSGHIYDFTTSDKNAFYFFIDDGESGQWYKAYGKTAAMAAKSLGKDIIDIDDYLRINAVNGRHYDEMQIYVLKQKSQESIEDNLRDYSWIRLYDLYDRSYDTCHYYYITNQGDVVNQGKISKTFSYVGDGGEISSYSFVDNIGDRDLIGKRMVPANSVKFIKYYDEGGELIEYRSIYSPSEGASWDLPSIVRNGVPVKWYSGDDLVTSLETVTGSGEDVILNGKWIDNSVNINVEIADGNNGIVTTVYIPPLESEVYLRAITRTQGGFVESTYVLNAENDWKTDIPVSEAHASMMLYLVEDINGSFEYNVGCETLNIGAMP